KVHRLGATWELLFDPVTVCFVVGAVAMVLLRARGDRRRRISSFAAVLVCLLIWAPVRVGILMALILHRALRTDFDAPLKVMDAFFSVWMLVGLALPLALLCWRFVRRGELLGAEADDPSERGAVWWMIKPALVALAVVMVTFGVLYDPVGNRKGGRVIVDEY